MRDSARPSADWLGSLRINTVAWWFPQCAILAALLLPPNVRSAIWIVALAWMGTACLMNARRCGRTHCRFTGPFYLALIVPTLALRALSVGFYGWLALGLLIIGGSKLIWWATERAWGKFS